MPLWTFLPLSLICAGIVLYRYHSSNRVASGIGWAVIILAIGGFGSGLAASFTWSGFVFALAAAAGGLIIVQDAIIRRQARRKSTTGARQQH